MIHWRILIMIFLLPFLGSCNTSVRSETPAFNFDPGCVQIVMFRLEMKCESCIAVETETRSILEEEYSEELTNEEIRFLIYNHQSESGKRAANILSATGQALFVVKGDSISDLSGIAFIFSQTNPERYHKALRTEIDKFLE